jgi:mannose-6-phosphate isomerase-like protein (cupin superfamily)
MNPLAPVISTTPGRYDSDMAGSLTASCTDLQYDAAMAVTRLPLPAMDWAQSPTHPLEKKKVVAGRSAALLQFAPGFADPNACQRSHVLYVVSGTLELALDGGAVERVTAGEACWIDRGSRHHARNPGTEPAVVFIVSDVAPET